MKWTALIALVALGGCNVYHPIPAAAVVPDENTIGRQCLIESASPFGLFGLAGGLASYASDRNSMDACMARHGWVRN